MSAVHLGFNHKTLKNLETISKKLASPTSTSFTEEEVVVMSQIRHKECTSPRLHSLEQFFANSVLSG
jgi:hypothetical protein